MTDVKDGAWVKIPKGTKLLGHRGFDGETKRDVMVKVTVSAPWAEEWVGFLSPEEQIKYRTRPGRHTSHLRASEEDTSAEPFKDLARKALGFHDLRVIMWSDKSTFAHFAEVVDEPAPRKKSTPKINKKQQMVPKSTWKATQDKDIVISIRNLAVDKALQTWFNANPRPWGHSDSDYEEWQKWEAARQAHLAHLHATLGEYEEILIRSIKAGEVMTVTSKWTTYSPYDILIRGDSWANFKFSDGSELALPYKALEPVVEADNIPTVDVFVIRQKSTGLFYKGHNYMGAETSAAQKEHHEKTGKWPEWHEVAVYSLVFVDNFMKAKQYDGLSRAKSSVLEMSGYYQGLPGSENLPEWMGHGKTLDITDDFEFVKFDKLGRQEVETLDLWSWYQRAWELRALTVQFGSSVRAVYNDLDKRGELDEQKGLLVFKAPDDQEHDWRMGNDKSVFTPEQQKSVDDLLGTMKRGTFRKAQDFRSVSISFKDKGAAMIAKLTYSGSLKMHVLDLETLKEAMDD